MSEPTIACRARLDDVDCYDGSPTSRQFGTDEEGTPENLPLSDDGTFDGRSIVCDACYVALMPFTRSGQALNDELAEAIATYRRNLEYIRSVEDPSKPRDQARAAAEGCRAYSPLRASAEACVAMANRELARRS